MLLCTLPIGLVGRSAFHEFGETGRFALVHGKTGILKGSFLGIATDWLHGLYLCARVS